MLQMGAYHTIDLEMNRPFTLGKQEWDSVSLERIGTCVCVVVYVHYELVCVVFLRHLKSEPLPGGRGILIRPFTYLCAVHAAICGTGISYYAFI